ncbi:unnamed protein product, partial [Mesorhabditis belari]|uniref:BRICHOS domain-containing protein n=1 Tax=Mesorhabditis belari TaxID=2138241 RepID=A0AAF3E8V7_9BILA
MDGGNGRRSVEQFEIIEHQVTEERRPAGSAVPFTSIRKTTESFERQGDEILNRRYEITEERDIPGRFDQTGERDMSREPSFLHTSANYGQQIEFSPQRHQLSSSSAINNYGYDIHEVHTSEGGARIVETHGGGPLQQETPTSRPGISSALRSGSSLRSSGGVFTVPSPPLAKDESWRHDTSTEHESFVRKDSYKRMQQSQEVIGSNGTVAGPAESSRVYAPRSQSTLMSNSSRARRDTGEGCWSKMKNFFSDLYWAIKREQHSPRLWANVCCILLMLLLLLILFIVFLTALFHRYSVREFLLYPPVCEECRRKNPSLASAQMPSSVYVHHYSSEQAHFEMRGNLPFRSNSFTAIDFSTGYVAIADHALTDSTGKHFSCFLLPLDRTALPSMDSLMEALDESDYEIQSNFGWQEYWQFEPEQIDYNMVRSKFTDPIKDCESGKWYLLKQTVHPRDGSCSDCYDFCLPDYAVVRKVKYEDESTLGIRRLNCFRLYVPEWGSHSPQTDAWGGHWQYPLQSTNTRRDSDFEWQSWTPIAGNRIRQTRSRIDKEK